jgi:hypothetical protein
MKSQFNAPWTTDVRRSGTESGRFSISLLVIIFCLFTGFSLLADKLQAAPGARSLEHAQLQAILTQAIADDAAGQHEQAHKWFAALAGTELQGESAMPAAVNLVLLERFDDARKAFGAIASGTDRKAASYAQFWQLWLSARTWRGSPADLRRQLAVQARALRATDPAHQALARLYAGQGDAQAVFTAIDAMTLDDATRRDLRAECAFFAGSWAQYVAGDKPAARHLYQRELVNAGDSLERPLLQQALAELS